MSSTGAPDGSGHTLSDDEFQEILTRNKSVSSSAISRAVQDASQGMYAWISLEWLSGPAIAGLRSSSYGSLQGFV